MDHKVIKCSICGAVDPEFTDTIEGVVHHVEYSYYQVSEEDVDIEYYLCGPMKMRVLDTFRNLIEKVK